jgi:hypothetical protein
MLFVPYVPPQHPSPRAEELARRLKDVIDQYSSLHPDLSAEDIRQAAQLAAASRGQDKRVVVAAVVGALALAACVMIAVLKHQTQMDEQLILPAIVLVVGIAVVGLLFYLKSR